MAVTQDAFRSAEANLFRSLNTVVEPLVRSGLLGPGLLPIGPAVLAIRGRKSRRVYNVPLLGMRICPVLLVATLRGERSQWLRNLRANPGVRWWWNGEANNGSALVLPAGGQAPPSEPRTAFLSLVISQLQPWTLAGWSFALILPEAAEGQQTTAEHPFR